MSDKNNSSLHPFWCKLPRRNFENVSFCDHFFCAAICNKNRQKHWMMQGFAKVSRFYESNIIEFDDFFLSILSSPFLSFRLLFYESMRKTKSKSLTPNRLEVLEMHPTHNGGE